jgi:hypothetical protein
VLSLEKYFWLFFSFLFFFMVEQGGLGGDDTKQPSTMEKGKKKNKFVPDKTVIYN